MKNQKIQLIMKNFTLSILLLLSVNVIAQEINIKKSLSGFDKYMSNVLTDWNEPGAGVAVIYKGELVFVKGYGYRDYGNKLPVTKNTLFQIASNTKLFTAVAAGMLVAIILDGLSLNEHLIVKGHQLLADGAKVKVEAN